MNDTNQSPDLKWDIFISYASEDRDAVANPLTEALRSRGIKVWYDQTELKAGDSLFDSISEGLRLSRFGIVILSPAFFTKQWPQLELKGLFNRIAVTNGHKTIIPVWYQLGPADIEKYSPLLTDIVAIRWESGLSVVIEEILRVLATNENETSLPPLPHVFAIVRRALSQPDYAMQLKEIAQKYSVPEISQSLNKIVFDIEQPIRIRIRALQELVALDEGMESFEWNALLAEPVTELIDTIIALLTASRFLLTQQQLEILFANPALPRKQSGLGKMVIGFIHRGASYTSKVFTPLANYPSWEIKYDCVKSIIALDDTDSIPTLFPFLTMSYWQPRHRTANYLLQRYQENRVSLAEKAIAGQILTRMITDGKTEEGSPTMHVAKRAFVVINSNITT
jgi:hypothetical protein